MHEMTVKLTWDADKLSPMWMNSDNLNLLLYTQINTERDLLQVEVLDHCIFHDKQPEDAQKESDVEIEIKATEDPVSVAREVMKMIKRELRRALDFEPLEKC